MKTQNPEWVEDAHLAIASLAATGQQFTADEVACWLSHHSEHVPDNPRAMGGVLKFASKHGAIDALSAWQSSVRSGKRAMRLFRGNGRADPAHVPTETHVMWALEALNEVGQQRSELMVAELRKASH